MVKSHTKGILVQQEIICLMERLQRISCQMDMYNNTISPEKAYNMLYDEVDAMSSDIMLTEDTEAYCKRMLEFCSFLYRKWQEFYETYSIEDLNLVLNGLRVKQDDTKIYGVTNINIMSQLEDRGVKIRELDPKEIVFVKNLLGSCCDKYYGAWSIENAVTEARYTDFLNQSKDVCTKLLLHGSGNENWWNIINYGLVTNPQNVMIEGKMFGKGIYFAVNAEKSYSFSSIKMANKRRKFSNTSFIGVYEVACGIPYDVYTYEPVFADFDYEELQKVKQGAHCLHAHKGEMLNNDEIVIYKDEQATIRYLIELRE